MTLPISSALQPSVLEFSRNKEYKTVKQHSIRKERIRLYKCVYSQVHYVAETQNKLHELSLPFMFFNGYEQKFSRVFTISNDPLKFFDND
jgi:hypothetical protein